MVALFQRQGDQICWRFSPSGHKAEIFTMNLETRRKKLTNLNAMFGLPFPSVRQIPHFFHKSSRFNNFELYVVDTEGQKKPIRVTNADGFDGLPCFSPDGQTLSWTSNRTNNKKSQIFMANWNHKEMLNHLDSAESIEGSRVTKNPRLRLTRRLRK